MRQVVAAGLHEGEPVLVSEISDVGHEVPPAGLPSESMISILICNVKSGLLMELIDTIHRLLQWGVHHVSAPKP
jgi:hypothetical protein